VHASFHGSEDHKVTLTKCTGEHGIEDSSNPDSWETRDQERAQERQAVRSLLGGLEDPFS
jgi:hypothetical protein